MIEIPKVTPKNSQLSTCRGSWICLYYRDGKQNRKSLGPVSTVSRKKAEAKRDAFFAELLATGKAVPRRKKTPQEKIQDNPGMYIRYRLPYVVVVAGHFVGEAGTNGAAIKMLNDYLAGVKQEKVEEEDEEVEAILEARPGLAKRMDY